MHVLVTWSPLYVRVTACFLGAILVWAPVVSAAIHVDAGGGVLLFTPGEIETREQDGRLVVRLGSAPRARFTSGPIGLPLVPVVIEVPAHFSVTDLALEVAETPVSVDGVTAGAPRGPHPIARILGQGFARGRRLVTLEFAPLRPSAETGALVLATRIAFRLELVQSADRPLERLRSIPTAEARFARGLARIASGVMPGDATSKTVAGGPAPFLPTFSPSTDGSPVEYVIVTSEALRDSFEVLAEWRTRSGRQAVVRTMEWIRSAYANGADPAEQLRFFLQDAYQNWGTLWVLLGGDTDVIPARYVYSLVQTTPDAPHVIPTDLYYGCLDGNWNADGDDRVGEGFLTMADPGDDADLFHDLIVGRAPVSTPAQAGTFVRKLLDYERQPPVDQNYPASVLLLAEDLGFDDGAEYAEDVVALLHPWMRVVRLYENFVGFPGSLELTVQAAHDSIDSGFGWVHHVGHGFRNTMSVADGSITNITTDAMQNSSRQSFVFAINCSSASIDFNSVGERWLKNPAGGAVGYIGTTREALAAPARRYGNEFYRLAFEDSVDTAGECLFLTRAVWAGASSGENFDRYTQMSLILLGDPALPLWTNRPTPLSADHDPTIALGAGSFTVTAKNEATDPVPGALVTLWAPAEDYRTGLTDSTGQATVVFDPESPGTFSATVTRRNFLPYETEVPVDSTATPFLVVNSVSIVDDGSGASEGNGDGRADAGETVELIVELTNTGQVEATGVSDSLVVEHGAPEVTVLSGQVAMSDIAPGATASATHLVQVSMSAPHGLQALLRVDAVTGQGAWSDLVALPVHTIEIDQYDHQWADPLPGGNGNGVIETGETIAYTVELRNAGSGEAVGILATLRVLDTVTGEQDPDVIMTDDEASYGDLAPGERVSGAYGFVVGVGADPSELLLELTTEDARDTLWIQCSDLEPPGAVDSLRAVGSTASIQLVWAPGSDPDLLGYDIRRSTSPGGPFLRVNEHTVMGSSFFEDHGLPPLSRFYYQVVARDSSFNTGAASPVIEGTTNPPLHLGWPIEMSQSTTSGVKVYDLVPGGSLEMVTGSDCIYAWSADGTEIVDGDGNPSTPGIFTLEGCDSLGIGFRSDPAIADLDHDGAVEIIFAGWHHSSPQIGFLHVLGPDGTPRPGWPRSLGNRWNWGSAAVGQLRAGGFQVVAMQGGGGVLYAFDHAGDELLDGDGNPSTIGPFFSTGSSFNYASPALSDLDLDGFDEVIVGTRTGAVFVVDGDGSVLPGWPQAMGGKVTASPAIADLDSIPPAEIVIAAQDDSVYVLTADGGRFPGWPQPAAVNTNTDRTSSPIVVDLDQDGGLDIFYVASDGQCHAWTTGGSVMPGWENVFIAQSEAEASQCTPTVGDVDGDGDHELLFGGEDGKLYGFNHDGSELAGFPIQLGGEVRGSVTIQDIDADGLVEIAHAGWDGQVHVWDMQGAYDPALTPWPYFRRDLMNRGSLEPFDFVVGVAGSEPTAPLLFRLGRARPNPFHPVTTIDFEVPAQTAVLSMRIYDVNGRLWRTLLDGPAAPGRHHVVWDGRDDRGRILPAGVYFVRAAAPGFEAARKLLMVR